MSAHAQSRRGWVPGPEPVVDPVLVALIAALLGVGLVMVASASMSLSERDYGDPFYFFWRQVSAAGAGLGGAWVMVKIPTRVWERSGLLLAGLALLLLLAVLVPGLGREAKGSTRWLSVAGVNLIQVSEPARLLLLMYVAGYVVRRNQELRSSLTGFARPMLFPLLACGLLLLQPDFGAAVMVIIVTLAVLFAGGARIRDFLLCSVVVAGVGAVAAVSAPYRWIRLVTFLNPWEYPYDKGFQLTQSLIAIGSGEWAGLGLGGSVQKLFYLPEPHTDFVFAVIAEEFGLLGSVTLILLFGLLISRAFIIARQAVAKERLHAACLAFGVAVWVALQVFINIGVTMGILPTKGLTLPLVSYGRSSVIVMLLAFGLLARVDLENRRGNGGGRRRPGAERRIPG